MAAVIGSIKGAVKDAVGAVTDQVQLPKGEWIDAGPVCDAPCLIAGLCPCSCIVVYMTWGKIMLEEQQKQAGIVCCGNCIGLIIGIIAGVVGSLIEMPVLGVLACPCMMCGQAAALVNQRKALGKWMNIEEEKLATPMDMFCALCCCCFLVSAESRSVDDWMSKTMLVQAPLKAAHEAKKQLDQAAGSLTQP